jgi:hypothetical protein
MALPQCAVLDPCLPLSKQASRGLGARYLLWECRRHGVPVVEPDRADALLVSCVHPEQAATIATYRRGFPRAVLIVGGAGSLSPCALGAEATAVVCGDGQRFMERLGTGLDAAMALPEVWVQGGTEPVEIAQGFPWNMPPMQAEDGAYRVWLGRGCKNRCGFCQTGWALEWNEHPEPAALVVQAQRLAAQGKRVVPMTNDPAQHECATRLPPSAHGSYSIAYMRKRGLPACRQIRIGVEGPSERLRTLVSKPISRPDLLGCTKWLLGNGRSVRWFLIAGLPTETDDDWLELRECVQEVKRDAPKGVCALSFSAWCPEPATPMGTLPIDDGYWERWKQFREWFFGGKGWSNRIKIMAPANPKTRLRRSIAQMAVTETELRRGGAVSPNQRLSYPHAAARVAADKRRTRLVSETHAPR